MSNDTTEATQEAEVTAAPELPTLTSEQEIAALRSVHEFLAKFDRVPGFLANQWSQALDTVAVVANSLIKKAQENDTTTTEAESDETVTQ